MLEVGDSVHVSDLVAPKGVTIVESPEEIVASVVAPAKAEEEAPVLEAEQPEVIGEEEEASAEQARPPHMTRLVIGLGNPGPEYASTRHNAGFMVVDLLAETLGATYWKGEAGARTAKVRFGEGDLVLAKPQSFMNVSGKSVKRLLERYDVPVDEVVVVHDDLDLAAGDVRAKRAGGHGGHNGLRSLHGAVGDSYMRVRVGIGRPPGRMDPADFVLEPLRGEALERLREAIPTAAQVVVDVLERGIDAAMADHNG